MAQVQSQQPDPLAPFKEQLRKLAEEAGPVQCPSGETFSVYGSLFIAHYQCDELVDLFAGGELPTTWAGLRTVWRRVLASLRSYYGEDAFHIFPPGLLYILSERGYDSPSFILGFNRPFHSALTQFHTALPLVLSLYDVGRGFFDIINRRDVYMLYIAASIDSREFAVYFTFGLADDLRDDSKAPLAGLFRRDRATLFTGLTETRFTGTDFGISPIHIEQEVFSLGDFIFETIAHGRLSLWVHKDSCSGLANIYSYIPPTTKKQGIKK